MVGLVVDPTSRCGNVEDKVVFEKSPQFTSPGFLAQKCRRQSMEDSVNPALGELGLAPLKSGGDRKLIFFVLMLNAFSMGFFDL